MPKDTRNGLLGTAQNDGFTRFLEIEVKEVRDGYACNRLLIRPELCNSFGMAHGGAIFSLADQALASASNAGRTKSVAINVTISYMQPARQGQILTAEARREEKRRVVSLYSIDVTSETGHRVARAQALVYHLTS